MHNKNNTMIEVDPTMKLDLQEKKLYNGSQQLVERKNHSQKNGQILNNRDIKSMQNIKAEIKLQIQNPQIKKLMDAIHKYQIQFQKNNKTILRTERIMQIHDFNFYLKDEEEFNLQNCEILFSKFRENDSKFYHHEYYYVQFSVQNNILILEAIEEQNLQEKIDNNEQYQIFEVQYQEIQLRAKILNIIIDIRKKYRSSIQNDFCKEQEINEDKLSIQNNFYDIEEIFILHNNILKIDYDRKKYNLTPDQKKYLLFPKFTEMDQKYPPKQKPIKKFTNLKLAVSKNNGILNLQLLDNNKQFLGTNIQKKYQYLNHQQISQQQMLRNQFEYQNQQLQKIIIPNKSLQSQSSHDSYPQSPLLKKGDDEFINDDNLSLELNYSQQSQDINNIENNTLMDSNNSLQQQELQDNQQQQLSPQKKQYVNQQLNYYPEQQHQNQEPQQNLISPQKHLNQQLCLQIPQQLQNQNIQYENLPHYLYPLDPNESDSQQQCLQQNMELEPQVQQYYNPNQQAQTFQNCNQQQQQYCSQQNKFLQNLQQQPQNYQQQQQQQQHQHQIIHNNFIQQPNNNNNQDDQRMYSQNQNSILLQDQIDTENDEKECELEQEQEYNIPSSQTQSRNFDYFSP